jgi:hypothetical protein
VRVRRFLVEQVVKKFFKAAPTGDIYKQPTPTTA